MFFLLKVSHFSLPRSAMCGWVGPNPCCTTMFWCPRSCNALAPSSVRCAALPPSRMSTTATVNPVFSLLPDYASRKQASEERRSEGVTGRACFILHTCLTVTLKMCIVRDQQPSCEPDPSTRVHMDETKDPPRVIPNPISSYPIPFTGRFSTVYYCFATVGLRMHTLCRNRDVTCLVPSARPFCPVWWQWQWQWQCRAHHCRLCGRCVVRMDHHCPWMNNCVGIANQKYFILFLFYVLAVTGYAIGLVLYHFVECVAEEYCDDYSTLTANLIRAVLVISAAAMVFTLSMLLNQFHGVITGLGTVDRMQRRRKEGRVRGGPEDFRPLRWTDIFGDGNKLMWIFPTD
ncbi:unnamed protein product, partial [Ectocarpus sp. 12 AP-2014]